MDKYVVKRGFHDFRFGAVVEKSTIELDKSEARGLLDKGLVIALPVKKPEITELPNSEKPKTKRTKKAGK